MGSATYFVLLPLEFFVAVNLCLGDPLLLSFSMVRVFSGFSLDVFYLEAFCTIV
jgi:hypothetical protein